MTRAAERACFFTFKNYQVKITFKDNQAGAKQ